MPGRLVAGQVFCVNLSAFGSQAAVNVANHLGYRYANADAKARAILPRLLPVYMRIEDEPARTSDSNAQR
jgi:hypothetical protein